METKFWIRLNKLCDENNTKPTPVAVACGLGNSVAVRWKNGSIPRGATAQKLADYFGVSIDYLLGYEDNKDELTEYLEELKTRPEMKMLFSVAKGATKEDIEKAVAIIEALRKTNNG